MAPLWPLDPLLKLLNHLPPTDIPLRSGRKLSLKPSVSVLMVIQSEKLDQQKRFDEASDLQDLQPTQLRNIKHIALGGSKTHTSIDFTCLCSRLTNH